MQTNILRNALTVSFGYALLVSTLLILLAIIVEFLHHDLSHIVILNDLFGYAIILALVLGALFFLPILLMLLWPGAMRYFAWVLVLASTIFSIYILIGTKRNFCEELAREILVEGKGIGVGLGVLTVFLFALEVLVQALERGAWKAGIIERKRYLSEALLFGVPIALWTLLSVNGFGYVFATIYNCA